jgi:hypothetical protein
MKTSKHNIFPAVKKDIKDFLTSEEGVSTRRTYPQLQWELSPLLLVWQLP